MIQTELHTETSSPAPAVHPPSLPPRLRAEAGVPTHNEAPRGADPAPCGASDEEMAVALLRREPWAERVAAEWATPDAYPLAAAVRRMLRAAEIGREAVRTTSGGKESGGSGVGRTSLHIAYRAAIHLEAALHTLDNQRRRG